MKKFIILIPLFNDWKSVSRLLNEIDLEVKNWDVDVSIVIVNDASTEKRSGLEFNFKKIKAVKILNMKKNTVHQRCIATGLKYISQNEDFDRVIVMDADGEDRPEELKRYEDKLKKAVFDYSRAEASSNNGRSSTARKFYGNNESLCTQMQVFSSGLIEL